MNREITNGEKVFDVRIFNFPLKEVVLVQEQYLDGRLEARSESVTMSSLLMLT